MATQIDNTPPSRRLFLASGTAAAVFTALHGSTLSGRDAFTSRHLEILRLHEEINGPGSDEQVAHLFDRWHEIDDEIMQMTPSSLPEALGALEYARREHLQFAMAGEGDGDPCAMIVLHLIDGALGVLRRVTA